MYSWNYKDENKNIPYSTSPTTFGRSSPDADSSDSEEYEGPQDPNGRRGRPRADAITKLIFKGAVSMSSIRCETCNRVFPREKSLQAHMRTHTGERPYLCDYPSCGKSFCQSGQLKTHQRLHTGEKPFVCSANGCESLFTHANRHCQDHPYASLKRVNPQITINGLQKLIQGESNPAVRDWLTRQITNKEERIFNRQRPGNVKRAKKSPQEVNVKIEPELLPVPDENVMPLHQQQEEQMMEERLLESMTSHQHHQHHHQQQQHHQQHHHHQEQQQHQVHMLNSHCNMPLNNNQYMMPMNNNMCDMSMNSHYDMSMSNHCNLSVHGYDEPQPIILPQNQLQPVDSDYDYHTIDPYQPVDYDYLPQKEAHEMTLSEQTDKWISALALVELSHGMA